MKLNRLALFPPVMAALLTFSSSGVQVLAKDSSTSSTDSSTTVYLPIAVEGQSNTNHNTDNQTENLNDAEIAAQDQLFANATQIQPTVSITHTDFTQRTLIASFSTRPEFFVDCVDNPYFPLIPGTRYHYRERSDEGLQTTLITVTKQIKMIQGIHATEVHDSVFLEGELIEDTLDWYGQDDRGNVWYLGEKTAEYENGQVVTTAGSWQIGVKGGKAGFIMLASPRPDDLYREEFLKGEAEDMAAVMDLAQPAFTTFAAFNKSLQIADFNALNSTLEHKYFVRNIGNVRTVDIDEGGIIERLTRISHVSSEIELGRECGKNGGTPFVGTIWASSNDPNFAKLAKITAKQAEDAVHAVVGNLGIIKTVLEVKRRFLIYSVILNNGKVATVDAGDGLVLKIGTLFVDDDEDNPTPNLFR